MKTQTPGFPNGCFTVILIVAFIPVIGILTWLCL
jgi:hypothetical protein